MRRAESLIEDRAFPTAPAVTTVSIDRRTGLRANPQAYCRDVMTESFIAGTEPTAYCSVFHHQRLRLPYPFQAFPLSDSGALRVPVDELTELLAQEAGARIVAGGRQLEVLRASDDGRMETVRIDLEIVAAGDGSRTTAAEIALPPDAVIRPGHDGRQPRIQLLRAER
jgi:hypothetical protein